MNALPGLVDVTRDDVVRHHLTLVMVNVRIQNCVASDFRQLENDQNKEVHLHLNGFCNRRLSVVQKINFLRLKQNLRLLSQRFSWPNFQVKF